MTIETILHQNKIYVTFQPAGSVHQSKKLFDL